MCPLAMLMKEWVIVPARGGMGYCARWLCAWRSGLLCLLVEEWVIVPASYARGGVDYCARWLCAWRSGLFCPLAMLPSSDKRSHIGNSVKFTFFHR